MLNQPAHPENFRNLSAKEIDQLKNAHNTTTDWNKIFVSGIFDPSLIRDCHFTGKNYIESLSATEIKAGNIKLPAGLYRSTFENCVLQKNVAVHNVSWLYNYSIAEGTILFNVNEISCSEHPTFGNGYDKDHRNWIELANENGGRRILPFNDILSADAYLWSRFRDIAQLMQRLQDFTDKTKDNNGLSHGKIGKNCVVKNVKSIEDCHIASNCLIEGAARLKNLTILSSADEQTCIGNDVELVNGIIGFNNKISSAARCFNFITSRNVKIELGARVMHTFVGCNSTIACCEVLNNLIFPFHEQHHNNSFLIAATVMGQSNIAAGATIGSNHNSRAADGEILARRGFWPGLESDYKHNSSFASFSLIAKGSYESELNVQLPFSLVSKDKSSHLQIFPAFWFRYNMYALARNSWKFKTRDKRKVKDQNIEMDYLAPDTLFEISTAITILHEAIRKSKNEIPQIDIFKFEKIEDLNDIQLEGMAPKQKVHVIKPLQALWIYKNLIWFAAAKELVSVAPASIEECRELFRNLPPIKLWHNFGGQLISEAETETLTNDILKRNINSWQDVHDRYNLLWGKYPQHKLQFALACWLNMEKEVIENITVAKIEKMIEHSIKFNNALLEWTTEAREKDYDNTFRQITYSNPEEMKAVLGIFDDDIFIKLMKDENNKYFQQASIMISKLKKDD